MREVIPRLLFSGDKANIHDVREGMASQWWREGCQTTRCPRSTNVEERKPPNERQQAAATSANTHPQNTRANFWERRTRSVSHPLNSLQSRNVKNHRSWPATPLRGAPPLPPPLPPSPSETVLPPSMSPSPLSPAPIPPSAASAGIPAASGDERSGGASCLVIRSSPRREKRIGSAEVS